MHSATDVLCQLEDHYSTYNDEVSQESDLSDGIDESVNTYVNIIEDLDDIERKNKYKGKPQFSPDVTMCLATLSASERAGIILKLATDTIDEKIELDKNADGPRTYHEEEQDIPPEDSSLIYKNANNHYYSGMYSDEARLLDQATSQHHTTVRLQTFEGSDTDDEISQHIKSYQLADDLGGKKKSGLKKKSASRSRENVESEIAADNKTFPEEFNATATQLVVKRKY